MTNSENPNMPSLLMQAARSAAIADGLVRKKSSSGKSSASPANMSGGGGTKSSHENTVAAALAMVAAGNKNVKVPLAHGKPQESTMSNTPSANIAHSNGMPGLAPNNTSSGASAAQRIASQQLAALKPSSTTPVPSAAIPQTTSVSRAASSGSSGGKKKGPPLRRGKWTPEEEAYANRLIQEFKAGLLPLTDGTTLRTFLSKLLNCDPMRISKKFVGSNCIGKQVFRRRTADINRLTPEQIHQSRAELSELERRFLERVATTNRVKSSGVNNNSSSNNNSTASSVAAASAAAKIRVDDLETADGNTPPWLRPPNGFKHGTGAATAAAQLSSGSNKAAMAGRALLDNGSNKRNSLGSAMNKSGSAGLLALMEFQQRQNRNSAGLLSNNLQDSAQNLLAAAAAADGKNTGGDALSQLRNAQRLASNNSMTNLMLKAGLSRDQLSELVRNHRSSNSLSNLMERQSSLDALMSLDFQSLQSIDNLANLIQTGRGSQVPRSGMKNWQSDLNNSTNSLAAVAASIGSNGNLSKLADARRLQSEGRMENLIKSLSSGNVRGQNNTFSNTNFNSILQNMQSGGSSNNLLNSASAMSLANMLRENSSTGLTALRMQDGLAQRNSSVDDFLSLVASGDIPHQDPHLLNMPLQSVLQQQQQNGNSTAAQLLAQQQLLQAANGGNNSLNRFSSLHGLGDSNGTGNVNNAQSLGDHIASLGGLGNQSSAASLLSKYASAQQFDSSDQGLKRKFDGNNQSPNKR